VSLCTRLESIGVEPPAVERPGAAAATTILFDPDAAADPTPDADGDTISTAMPSPPMPPPTRR
jgi:hypothetical protein